MLLETLAVVLPILGGVYAVWWTQRKTSQREYIEDLIEDRDRDRARIDALESSVTDLLAQVMQLRAQETLWRVVCVQQNIEIERLGGNAVPLPPGLTV